MAAADTAGRTTGTDRPAEPVKPGHWRTPAMRAAMVRRYVDKRQSMREIAAALGCVYSTVNKVLTDEGVQKRGRGGSTGRRPAPSSPTRATARTRRPRPNADPAPPSQSDRRRTRTGVGDAGAVS